MGGHRSLIQEQFRSFEEPGPQDSCVGFFVFSQALRNLLKRLHSWTVWTVPRACYPSSQQAETGG